MNEEQVFKYTCPKCGNKEYEIGEMRTKGSFWTSMIDFYSKRFTFVTCKKCRFTELYKVPMKKLAETINLISDRTRIH
jgi:predicted nucleic-acid-binding Zn-ribbon protein